MPLYEYQCEKCKHQFEQLAKNSSDRPSRCPKCGAKKPVRVISSFSSSAGSGGSDSCSTGTCPLG